MNTEDISNRVEGWQEKIGETAKKVTSAADECVRENAWTSILCAAMLGCVIGYLLANRHE